MTANQFRPNYHGVDRAEMNKNKIVSNSIISRVTEAVNMDKTTVFPVPSPFEKWAVSLMSNRGSGVRLQCPYKELA